MDENSKRVKQFSRRTFVLGLLSTALYTGLGARLAWLQVVHKDQYTTLSDKNRIHVNLTTPVRGYIIDRNGDILAHNEQNFRVQIVPEQTADMRASLDALGQIIDLRPSEKEAVLKRASKQAKFIPIEIKDNLEWEDVSAIEISLPDLPGISIDVGQKRLYPLAEKAAHIVGYVGAVSKKDMRDDPVFSLPGFQIGKTGIEKAYENVLRGRAGTKSIEVNVSGRMVRELGEVKGVIGKTIGLTIDNELQSQVMARLAQEKSAAAVIMDAHTGAIYALASHPSFDPNLFATTLPQDEWDRLLSDLGKPLNDKVLSGQYPPGSTFKMVVIMAALEAGIINEKSSFYCPGHYDVNEERFHCWKREGHGWVNLYSALSESCDTFFYSIARDVGIKRIAAMARRLGLGHTYDMALPQEQPGLVPDQNWKRGAFGTSWQPGETIVASIGQGYILTTPLQLAVMTARLVNGGQAVKPWVVSYDGNTRTHERHKWPAIGLKEKHIGMVMRGMEMVVNDKTGTAKGSAIHEEGLQMGGKTGTSQVKRITMEERRAGRLSQEEIMWQHRHHALFVGYAPLSSPRYVCSVIVEHGASGSGAAAPIARDILLAAQQINPAANPAQTEVKA